MCTGYTAVTVNFNTWFLPYRNSRRVRERDKLPEHSDSILCAPWIGISDTDADTIGRHGTEYGIAFGNTIRAPDLLSWQNRTSTLHTDPPFRRRRKAHSARCRLCRWSCRRPLCRTDGLYNVRKSYVYFPQTYASRKISLSDSEYRRKERRTRLRTYLYRAQSTGATNGITTAAIRVRILSVNIVSTAVWRGYPTYMTVWPANRYSERIALLCKTAS